MRAALAAAVLLLGLASFALAGSVKDLDFKNGFRDAIFGTKLKSFDGAVLNETKAGMKFYRRPADKLKVGDANLALVTYGFYRGRLTSIHLYTDNELDSLALAAALEAAYGPGMRADAKSQNRKWNGQNVTMSLEMDPITGSAEVLLRSVEWTERMVRDQRKRAVESAPDDL